MNSLLLVNLLKGLNKHDWIEVEKMIERIRTREKYEYLFKIPDYWKSSDKT